MMVLLPTAAAATALLLMLRGAAAADDPAADLKLVRQHVADSANATFRPPSGTLKYSYLVPAGPYNEMWDWDSMFMGVALLDFGSLPYFSGTFMNFLDHTNVTDGEVQGCLVPGGGTGTIYHAKPILLQGAWLSAKHDKSGSVLKGFQQYKPQMKALLDYWERSPRKHASTGLYLWHDQLQTGADDLVTSTCPSKYSKCWDESLDAFTLASVDLHVFLYREHTAYARFCSAWAASATADAVAAAAAAALETEAAQHLAHAQTILTTMEKYLWDETLGHYIARNVSGAGSPITNRVFLMALPLWGGVAPAAHASKIAANVLGQDMLSEWGIRSTASSDARYSNANIINPYSNWRGPVWINANAMILYGLVAARYNTGSGESDGLAARAAKVAATVTHALAEDLRINGTWHECLSSATGRGLAAPGFLSWDTLGATLLTDVQQKQDPFAL